MRIKTMQRNTTNVMRLLKICRGLRRKKIEKQMDKVLRKIQEIEREQDEREFLGVVEPGKF